VQASLDAPVQQLPERGHADHAGDVSILNCFREVLATQLRQISDLRAATEWSEKTGRNSNV